MLSTLLITPPQVMTRFARREDVTFIDCRSDELWQRAAWKVRGALRAGPGAGETACVTRHRTVIVYGERGWEDRALRVVHHLHALGYEDVRILAGGFAEWSDLGLPLEPVGDATTARA